MSMGQTPSPWTKNVYDPTKKQVWEMTRSEFMESEEAQLNYIAKNRLGKKPSPLDYLTEEEYHTQILPWERTMTRRLAGDIHREEVTNALIEGLPVPQEVLNDYPGIMKETYYQRRKRRS